jgi:hypothetical protein
MLLVGNAKFKEGDLVGARKLYEQVSSAPGPEHVSEHKNPVLVLPACALVASDDVSCAKVADTLRSVLAREPTSTVYTKGTEVSKIEHAGTSALSMYGQTLNNLALVLGRLGQHRAVVDVTTECLECPQQDESAKAKVSAHSPPCPPIVLA